MFHMKKTFLVIICSFGFLACSNKDRKEDLLLEIDRLKIENDSLIKFSRIEKTPSNYWFDSDFDGEAFLDQGIKDPVFLIESSLREQPELIPLKAVLGGTMHFGTIQLLSSEWLIADFDDGHIMGRAIYEYHLNKYKELDFKLLHVLGPE